MRIVLLEFVAKHVLIRLKRRVGAAVGCDQLTFKINGSQPAAALGVRISQ